MDILTEKVTELRNGVSESGSIGSLPVFEAGEMDRLLALIEQFAVPPAEYPLVRDYVMLRMAQGATVGQAICGLERILLYRRGNK